MSMNTIEAIKAVLSATSSYGGANSARDALRELVAAYDALAPDWSQAPEWAMWSAIHANGLRYWMEKEPSWQHGDVGWDRNGGKQEFDFDCDESLPIGVDWRLLKWQRPKGVQNG